MVILSIDSGLERTGYALFKKEANGNTSFKYLSSGLIKTSSKKRLEERMSELYKHLKKIVEKFKPEVIVVERLFFFKNLKTAILVSQAQGMALLVAGQMNLPVEFLTPLEIKQTVTGYGKADKKSVQKMLALTLKLDKELKQDDQADAIACGLAYCYINKKLV